MTGLLRHWVAVSALVFLTGCASDVRIMVSDLDGQSVEVELVNTPFYSQVSDQCGPSALATILAVSGVTVAPEELKSSVYIPDREGSLQIELLAATRGYKRIPYLIDPEITALLGELRVGRPVLVLQNLGTRLAPVWHYAVVVGYQPDEKRIILRSGDQERHLVSAARFIRSWQRAGYWGIVVLFPGNLPSMPDAEKYVRSVAALEAVGDFESAAAGYYAATERWPEEPMAWLGLGNASYAQGDPGAAERAYKRLLTIDSGHAAALNNLAQVQADRGCYEEAVATLDIALSAAEPNTATYNIVKTAHQKIESRKSATACL